MGIVLDHTIVPVRDREEAVEFYTRIFGIDDLGAVGPFLAVKVNDSLNFDFQAYEEFQSIHYAFPMEADEFEGAFARIRGSGIASGDRPYAVENMQGPGMTMGAKGNEKRSTSRTTALMSSKSKPTRPTAA